jgi:VIT1/CCC1 family predicted Fe2+/Mn2+ transporter
VYGGIDGIVTTFAVVAGFTGAQSGESFTYSIVTVLLFGLANLFADASSMGLGNFLSLKSEKDYYKEQKEIEEREVHHETQREISETIQILESKGFSHDDAIKMTELYKGNKEYWVEFMMQYEVALPNPEGENPLLTAAATFFSFMVFGFIPLIPYLVIKETVPAFTYSALFTLIAMAILGTIRWQVTKLPLWRALFETILLGSLSASIAYAVGFFFRG